MKKICSLLLLSANLVYGQIKQDTFHGHQLLLPDIKLVSPTFSDDFSNDFLKRDFRLVPDDTVSLTQKSFFTDLRDMRAKFSHNTPNGSVYDLVYDNMPCLVPELKRSEKMPVRKLKNENPVDKMPNTAPHINVIP